MKRERLRIGQAGCGWWGHQHLKGWKAVSSAKLVALCDEDEGVLNKTGDEYAIPVKHRHSSLDSLLSDPEVEAVDLVVPNFRHADTSIKSLEAGKATLVEKPIARSVAEAESIIHAAKRAGKPFMVALNRRYAQSFSQARERIRKGEIGGIFLVRVHYLHYFPYSGWRADRDAMGGGSLLAAGTHLIDIALWLCGPVKEVFCTTTHRGLQNPDMEDTSVVNMTFTSGALGNVCITNGPSIPMQQKIWVHGTERVMEIDINELTMRDVKGKVLECRKMKNGDSQSIQSELSHFVDCARNNGTPLTSGEEALRSLQIIEAAYRSAEEGMAVGVAGDNARL